jgi:NTP pyrophosphatase (non-canonical NTP hydrolase)
MPALEEEIGDVLIYLVRLCDVAEVDRRGGAWLPVRRIPDPKRPGPPT